MDGSVKQLRERLLDQDFCEWCFIPFTMLLAACLIVLLTCSYQIAWVFSVQRDVTLGGPFTACEQPLGNRCTTEHEAISSDQSRRVFEPYMFEFEPGVLHYDRKIQKSKYSFTYRIDGYEEIWPYLPALSLGWVLSFIGLVAWWLLGGPRQLGRFLRHGED